MGYIINKVQPQIMLFSIAVYMRPILFSFLTYKNQKVVMYSWKSPSST